MADRRRGVGMTKHKIYDRGHLLGTDPFPLAGCVACAGWRRGDPEHEAVPGGRAVLVVVRLVGDIRGRDRSNFFL